jgi:hypothetical protein
MGALHHDEPRYTYWHSLRHRGEREAGSELDHLLVGPSPFKLQRSLPPRTLTATVGERKGH